jgi:hypothetical protein
MEKHTTPATLRKKRTRCLIQLGGLLEKADLLSDFGLQIGDDLQQDEQIQDNVATLFGALLELKETIRHNDHSPTLWKQKGKIGLKS